MGFQYFASFIYTAYRFVTLFTSYFVPEGTVLKLLECCYCFIVFFGTIVVYHIINGIQTVNGMQFSVKFVLIWILLSLSMPTAWLSLIFICIILFVCSRVSVHQFINSKIFDRMSWYNSFNI